MQPSAGQWLCSAEAPHLFEQTDGVPLLINPNRSLFRSEDFGSRARTTFKSPPRWALWLGQHLPSPSRDVAQANCLKTVAALLRARPEGRRRVLVVGCGDGSAAYGELAEVNGVEFLQTDVSLAGPASVVCDASDLPFDGGQWDLVVAVAVLEHVLEPQRCVDEMHRVLQPDGLVFVTTPFMQQVHMGEYDFMRFTRSGHRWLFREFAEIESGLATGPASVLVWSVEHFALAWTKTVALRRAVKACVRLALGWMTWMDWKLARSPAALDGAGGFFFIGRRSSRQVVSARDMLTYYRGGDASK